MIDWQMLLNPDPLNQLIWLAIAFVVIIAGTVSFSAIGLWRMGDEP